MTESMSIGLSDNAAYDSAFEMYRTLTVSAVLVYDGKGGYLLHAASDQTSAEMFKAIQPLWNFAPQTEAVQFITFDIKVPNLDRVPVAHVE
jgi:hypothetical protein